MVQTLSLYTFSLNSSSGVSLLLEVVCLARELLVLATELLVLPRVEIEFTPELLEDSPGCTLLVWYLWLWG